MGFATRQIHAGKHDNGVGALCTPIYQTSTFEFDTVQQGGARFAGQEEGYIYSRLGNPSLTQVEEKLAALEGGEAALATASGMGAISSALWSSVEAGDEIVASDTLYGCTFALLNHGMSKFGVSVKFVDFADLAAVKAALTEKTKVVYLETPCNPTLKARHFTSGGQDYLFQRNLYETRRMLYTLYNAIGDNPETWQNGQPVKFPSGNDKVKINLTIPADVTPQSFWPWRSEQITELFNSCPPGTYSLEAWDVYKNGVFQYTEYSIYVS